VVARNLGQIDKLGSIGNNAVKSVSLDRKKILADTTDIHERIDIPTWRSCFCYYTLFYYGNTMSRLIATLRKYDAD
jgi:hypothetical protein